jgi:hypothetical protein
MNIMLGNLSVRDIETRLGIAFSENLKKVLEKTYQCNATNITENEWHCFDLPFVLVCGSMSLAQTIYDELKDQQGDMKEPLQIAFYR